MSQPVEAFLQWRQVLVMHEKSCAGRDRCKAPPSVRVVRVCAHLCNLRMTLFYPQMTQATQIPALPGNAGFYNPRRMK